MEKQFDVLVVEDSSTQAMQLQFILEKHGYRVSIARNGREGLDMLEKDFYQIVITDWIMPEMDGLAFCQSIRKHDFSDYVYIILLTAKDGRDDIIAGLQGGADDYLVKPVHSAELAARLHTARRIINLERSLKKKNEEIALLSITDPLTKTYNRRYMNQHLPVALKRALRYQHPISVVICDIDHFKRVNDQYGHQTGDKVLVGFAECLKQAIREGLDWVVRYGGEEFALVLPDTNLEGAFVAAERYRNQVAEKPFETQNGPIAISASFGVASINPSEDNQTIRPEDLIAAADRCLYQAKEQGRNRSVGTCLE